MTSRRWPFLIAFLVGVFAVAVFAAVFDFNALRGPIERYASKTLQRDVQIGELEVKLGFTPLVRVRGFSIANTDWAIADGEPPLMAQAREIEFSLRLLPLLRGRVVLPHVRLTDAEADLVRLDDGRANFLFGPPGKPEDKPKPPPAEILALRVDAGRFSYRDEALKMQVQSRVQTRADAQWPTEVSFNGRFNRSEFKGRAQTGNVLSVRNTDQAFPVRVELAIEDTTVRAEGEITDIATLERIDADFFISGPSLANLYPTLRIALPASPPYQLQGRLRKEGNRYGYSAFSGKIGGSDVTGDGEFVIQEPRPMLTATLRSQTLRLSDLGPLVGVGERAADRASRPPGVTGAKGVAAANAASGGSGSRGAPGASGVGRVEPAGAENPTSAGRANERSAAQPPTAPAAAATSPPARSAGPPTKAAGAAAAQGTRRPAAAPGKASRAPSSAPPSAASGAASSTAPSTARSAQPAPPADGATALPAAPAMPKPAPPASDSPTPQQWRWDHGASLAAPLHMVSTRAPVVQTAPRAAGRGDPNAAADPPVATRDGRPANAPPRLLPDVDLDPQRLRAIDADVRLEVQTLVLPAQLAFRELVTRVRLDNARLSIEPLRFRFADGEVVASLQLDGTRQPVAASLAMDMRRLNLPDLFTAVPQMKASTGRIGAQIKLKGQGLSVADLLGTASGHVALGMDGGRVSRMAMAAASLNGGRLLQLLVGGDELVPIRCMGVNVDFTSGIGQMNQMVFDTEHVIVNGDGLVNLQLEVFESTLRSQPKEASILSLRAPVRVHGSFRNVDIEVGKSAAVRAGAALALGLINPLAALLPLIETGSGEDSDCRAVLAPVKNAQKQATNASKATPQPDAPRSAPVK